MDWCRCNHTRLVGSVRQVFHSKSVNQQIKSCTSKKKEEEINKEKKLLCWFNMCTLYDRIGRHSKSLDTQRFACAHCMGQLVLLTPSKPRAPTPFANFVKENYGSVRQELAGKTHADVMRKLSADFASQAKLTWGHLRLGSDRLSRKQKILLQRHRTSAPDIPRSFFTLRPAFLLNTLSSFLFLKPIWFIFYVCLRMFLPVHVFLCEFVSVCALTEPNFFVCLIVKKIQVIYEIHFIKISRYIFILFYFFPIWIPNKAKIVGLLEFRECWC